MTAPFDFGILGNGAQARENVSYLVPGTRFFFAVTREFVRAGIVDIEAPNSNEQVTPVIASVGAPGLRRRLIELWPGTGFTTLVASGATVAEGVSLGSGTVVAPGAVLAVGVSVGNHGLVNLGATLSHDVVLGDYVTVSPGAHVGGSTTIGDGVFVGIGATIVAGRSLAPGVVVGAGAVVLADVVEQNAVVVGNPARVLRVDDAWISSL